MRSSSRALLPSALPVGKVAGALKLQDDGKRLLLGNDVQQRHEVGMAQLEHHAHLVAKLLFGRLERTEGREGPGEMVYSHPGVMCCCHFGVFF